MLSCPTEPLFFWILGSRMGYTISLSQPFHSVEMFLLADGSILLNEVAPRPHNSGHYTMDGCVTSQVCLCPTYGNPSPLS